MNVEGLGSAITNGFEEWHSQANPDIIALQEIWSLPKFWDGAWPESHLGLHANWNPSTTKPGASGTALLSRRQPQRVSHECGIERMDGEGRWIIAEIGDLRILNVYVPYFWSDDPKQDKPCRILLDSLRMAITGLLERSGELLVVGDFNIAPPLHRDYTGTIKIDDPDTWPYKKAWMRSLEDLGLTDIHELQGHDPEAITWLNRRLANAKRGRRKGTRIDYHLATKGLADKAHSYSIDCATAGFGKNRISDHCSVLVDYKD